MPRVYAPRRTMTAVRLSPEGLTAIDTLATAIGVSRSEMIRQLLREALAARERTARR